MQRRASVTTGKQHTRLSLPPRKCLGQGHEAHGAVQEVSVRRETEKPGDDSIEYCGMALDGETCFGSDLVVEMIRHGEMINWHVWGSHGNVSHLK